MSTIPTTEPLAALPQTSAPLDWISSVPDWISAICNLLMLFVTLVSVYYAYRAYQHQKDRSKKEIACTLAKYYASNIIDKYGDIEYIFNQSGIFEIIRNKLPLGKLQEFDKDELISLLGANGMTLEEFENKLNNIDPKSILGARMSRACSPEERQTIFTSYTKLGEDGKAEVVNGLYLQVDFELEISGLLNELEWFAMNCKYGLADEELMYQSLHQTYLSTVWMLYYYISHRNENNEDKLYTNLVWLFIEWRNRLSQIRAEKEAEKQEHLRKAASVKAKVYEGTRLK